MQKALTFNNFKFMLKEVLTELIFGVWANMMQLT